MLIFFFFTDRRDVQLRKIDNKVVDPSMQGGVIATRSGRLMHKYRVSATTAMARKKAKVAKLSSMRPKQKLSRILQRYNLILGCYIGLLRKCLLFERKMLFLVIKCSFV